MALAAFSARGYHATAMSDVADVAGVTKPVLYQHFRSKRALYQELLETVGARMLTAVAKSVAGAASPEEQVREGFRAYVRFAASNPAAFALLFGGGAGSDPSFSAAVRAVEESLTQWIAAMLHAELDGEHRRLLARSLVKMAEGACRGWARPDDDPAPDPELLAARLAELAWAGLRGIGHCEG